MLRKGLLMVCLFGSLIAAAQTGNVQVKITNTENKALENVTVELLHDGDSSLVKITVTDNSGLAEFEDIAFGKYLLRASSVNYITGFSSLVDFSNNTLVTVPTIKLATKPKDLQDVTVITHKPFIQRMTDRIVVNVDNSIVNAGNTAMEVLQRSPGVLVDQNDNISLRGRSGVTIMMDGKPTAMSGADLANYLKSLPSSAIKQIDIITNPSAKYDAAGNAGIIDIKMKKDQRYGTNGTVTASYGQGVYPKVNGGIQMNYRNKKINVFGNYNQSYRIGLNHLFLDRNFYNNGVYNGGDLKDNYFKIPMQGNTARIGMDYSPSEKTIIGFIVNGSFYNRESENKNHSILINPQHQQVSIFNSLSNNNNKNNNIVSNLNFKHQFNNEGKELSADLNYGSFWSNALTRIHTTYYDLDGNKLQPDYILDGDQKGKLYFTTGRIDYTQPLSGKAKLEMGFKTSFVSSDNDVKFYDVSSGTPENDVNKTNHFLYKESNNAGYLNFSKTFKKFDLQLGLRGENTKLQTNQLKGNILFDSSYFQLFPSAFFNYKIKEDQTIGVSVSRRIDRPGYSQLNPFLFLIDVTTYSTGKPGLLPQLTWSYELNYVLKNINFTLGYSHTRDNQNVAIAKFKDVFPNIPSDDNVTVQIPINIASSDYYGLTVSAPVKINKWWNMINNAMIYYNHFNGSLGTTTLNTGKPTVDLRVNNSFQFKKGWSAELNGNFSSGGQYGFMVIDPNWGLDVGVQKIILHNKGRLRFGITDIFWTNLPKAVITYDNYIEKWHAFRESRVATLSFTYRFGNNKVKQARRRSTGSEEESQRARQ